MGKHNGWRFISGWNFWNINKYFEEFYDLKNIAKESTNQSGSKNSQYGTCWINNGIENKKIKKDDFINYPNWFLGIIKKSNHSSVGRAPSWKGGHKHQFDSDWLHIVN